MVDQELLFNCIRSIISSNPGVLSIPFKQRSKFEGWLKFELANLLVHYTEDITVERHIDNMLVDIKADDALIELKTPNTNVRKGVNDCQAKTRPITKNIKQILEDIDKLRQLLKRNPMVAKRGFIAFVLFPAPSIESVDKHLSIVNLKISPRTPKSQLVTSGRFSVVVYVAEV